MSRPTTARCFCPVHWSEALQRRHKTGGLSARYSRGAACRSGSRAFARTTFGKTFISDSLANGKDLVLAQRQAGLVCVSTTARRYDRRGALLLQQAVEDLWFPLPDELQAA
jgi:hypothetical protein